MVYQRIRYFLKAAEAGSFSKAAEKMYVSSQALTKQVRLLEEEIGGKLFERSAKGVRLTFLGEEALRRFSHIDQDLHRAMDDLRLRAQESKKRVSIGIFSALPQESLVTPIISFFLGSYPDYQVNLNLVELMEGRRMLMQGKLDLLLTNTHEEDDWEGSRCFCIEEHEAKVMVSLYHPWAMKDELTLADMTQEVFLKMDMDGGHYILQDNKSFYENIPCKKVQRVRNFSTLYALLQQGEAFAVFPQAYNQMDHEKLKFFDYPGRHFLFYTALLYNPSGAMGRWTGWCMKLRKSLKCGKLGETRIKFLHFFLSSDSQ